MNFLQKLTTKIQQFMVGRYGNDEFTRFLSITGLVLSILGNLPFLWFLYFIGTAMIFYGLFRSLSKNYQARRKEPNWYLLWSEKPKARIKLLVNKIRDRKTHRYFKCKQCKTVMRVPTGRGKIEITCPKCRAKTVKKT